MGFPSSTGAPINNPVFTGTVTAPILTGTGEHTAADFKASGLTGAIAASRYVGATASGAPTTGTFVVGDTVIDQTGKSWVCTAAGSPGTWVQIGGASTNVVATQQSTTSATYADLGTVGPAVTLVTGTQSLVMLTMGVDVATVSNATTCFMGVAVSGASTVAATDTQCASLGMTTWPLANPHVSAVYELTGLTPGSNTFTAKYRASAATASFRDRGITVIAA